MKLGTMNERLNLPCLHIHSSTWSKHTLNIVENAVADCDVSGSKHAPAEITDVGPRLGSAIRRSVFSPVVHQGYLRSEVQNGTRIGS